MGRKIPGRKHRGVRDPEKQNKERFNKIKSKINAPPTHIDQQDIPKSLSRLIELKDKVKSGEIPDKKTKKPKRAKGPVTSHPNGVKVKENEKSTPVFTQHTDETDRAFMYRVTKTCESVIKEAAFEKKYKVDIHRNPLTGEVEGVKKQGKDELVDYMKQLKKEKNEKGKKKKKKKKVEDEGPKLSKSQKRSAKLKERKEKKITDHKDEFKTFKDHVGFGEVVHAPPTLVAPRRVHKENCAPRPGVKNLLLKAVIEQNKQQKTAATKLEVKVKTGKTVKTANKAIDKKGKRKDLPNALRRQLDKQQSEIIEAYKELKKKKYINK